MKRLLISASVLVMSSVFAPAFAASTLAVGGGANLNGTLTGVTTSSHGLGGAVGAAGALQTSTGTGVAVSTPIGGISAGIGQSNGVAGSNAAAGGILGGGGTAVSGSLGGGLGVGGGFTNNLP